MIINRLLRRASVRYVHQHPWQAALAILGIALGVAVVTAIELTQQTTRAAFDRSLRSVLGEATHQVIGQAWGFDESEYRRVRNTLEWGTATPIIDTFITLPAHGGQSLRLIGIDPLSAITVNGARHGRSDSSFRDFMTEPGAAMINQTTANRLGIRPNDPLPIAVKGQSNILNIISVVDTTTGNTLGAITDDMVIVDIATAQEVLGHFGLISRIDLKLEGPKRALELQKLRDILPAHLEIIDIGRENRSAQQLTAAFYSNLSALSMLALLVGMFLIYNTQTIFVLQRSTLFARLRTVGVARRQLVILILFEAGILGVIGSGIGLVAGLGLAKLLGDMVSRTLNDLYYATSVSNLTINLEALGLGLALGTVATLLAALPPAMEAMRAHPATALAHRGDSSDRRRLMRLARYGGSGMLALSVLLVCLPTRSIGLGFASLFLLVTGAAMWTPALVARSVAVLRSWRCFDQSIPARLAIRASSAHAGRIGIAACALMIACATTIGMGIMISSFRGSVADWLDAFLRADIYVIDETRGDDFVGTSISLSTVTALKNSKDIVAASTVRRVKIRTDNGQARLVAYELPSQAQAGFQFIAGDANDYWARWESEPLVIVSEPYATRHGHQLGDAIRLLTDTGKQSFKIAGIYRDYASEQGTIAISRVLYARHWQDDAYDGVGLYLANNVDPRTALSALRLRLPQHAPLTFRLNAAIKQESLAIFDRTFKITEVLRFISLAIAFVGIFGALMAIQLERASDFGILRALGMSHAEIYRYILYQTGFIGLAAGLLAIPTGIAIAVVLIEVINVRSFGWSMDLMIDPQILLHAVLFALTAALLAGLYPAYRATQIDPAKALRNE